MTARRRSPILLAVVGLVAAGAIAGAAGLAYLYLRPAPPPAVGLATASPGSGQPVSTTGPSADPSETKAPGTLDSTWTIDPSIGSFSDFSSSYVGYRVNETLAENRANTAVGRTAGVAGSLVLSGSTITSVQIVADLTNLQSDDQRRDGRVQQQALQTDQFPRATFTLTSPIDLGSVPADGATFSVSATGDLNLHGVTRSVTIPLEAHLAGDVVTVVGSIDILFADYSIERPTSFFVLSIEDHGIMEFQLHFRRD